MCVRRLFVNKSVFPKLCNSTLVRSQHSSDLSATANSGYKDDPKKERNGSSESACSSLYNGHIPTSLFQKVLLTIGSSVCSIIDPYRHDMVAVLSETSGTFALEKIRQKMLQDPEGSIILREKPRINSETLDYKLLEQLPEGTFGHAYLKFLDDNKVSPDTRQPVQFVDDAETAYVIQRYREVHDLTHTLLGMPTNMLGEVAVKWVEAIQTGLPMCIAAAVLGPLRFKPKQRQKYINSYLPWSLNCGFRAKFIMNVYFEKRWDQELKSLRHELLIPDPPTL